jgi:hypothetical protein
MLDGLKPGCATALEHRAPTIADFDAALSPQTR